MWGQSEGQIIFSDGKPQRLQITDNHVQNNFETAFEKQEPVEGAGTGFNAENGNLHTEKDYRVDYGEMIRVVATAVLPYWAKTNSEALEHLQPNSSG